MKKQDLKKVVDFYNNVILQQIIKPVEIREIYKLVKPQGLDVPYFQKMRAISVYVQELQQNVIDELENMFNDFDEEQETITNDPTLSTYIHPDSAASPITPVDNQSHTEAPEYTETTTTGTTIITIDNEGLHAQMEHGYGQAPPADQQNLFDATQGLTETKDDGFELYKEKERLEADYKLADTSNLKRSITMKLKAINKKLEEKLKNE